MFSNDETDAFGKYASEFPTVALEDFLDEKSVDVIKDLGSTYYNLKNELFIPQHKREIKTIRFQLLCDNLNIHDWLLGIAKCLRYGRMIIVHLSFSYTVWKPLTGETRYIYAAKGKADTVVKFRTRAEFENIAGRFKHMQNHDFMMQEFMANLSSNVFESSGFIPKELVCSYCWITK